MEDRTPSWQDYLDVPPRAAYTPGWQRWFYRSLGPARSRNHLLRQAHRKHNKR